MQEKTVGLLIEPSSESGRGLLRGIARHVESRRHWHVLYAEGGRGPHHLPAWLEEGRFDGIVADVKSNFIVKHLGKLGRPMVDVRGRLRLPGVPFVGSDEKSVVETALLHLRERGLRRLAFHGINKKHVSEVRAAHFREIARRLSADEYLYLAPASLDERSSGPGGSELEDRELIRWLGLLPKPVGVLACSDLSGRNVINAANVLRLRVPDDVAVIGIGDDNVLCNLASPPLSSVIPGYERIGYEAAAMLDRVMQGDSAIPGEMLLTPLGVATRRSTDVLAIDDRHVVAALRYIREHVADGVTAEEVLDRLAADGDTAISRSTLDKRFLNHLGRTMKDEILRVRIECIKHLLQTTDHSLARITELVGMRHAEHLCVVFKRETSETPGAYRARHRLPTGRSKSKRS